MIESIKVNQGAKLLLITVGVIIAALGMRAGADIINTIALAVVLSVSLAPVSGWLIRKGLPQGWAIMMVAVIAVIVVLLLVVILVVSLQNVIDTLPTYQAQLQDLQNDLIELLEGYGVDISELRNSETFSSENLINTGVSAASAVVGALSSWFFMLLLIVYMLIEAVDFPAKVRSILATGSPMPDQLTKLGGSLRSYISITVWLGALNAVIMTVIMYLLGVDFALLWGILSFVMSFIPYVGFVIALVPPVALSLLESGLVRALIVLGAFLLVNTIIDNVIKPRVMGQGLDLSPLVVMLSLFIWAWILGPMGALLAVPMTIIVKELFLESSDDTRWIARMMEPSNVILKPDAAVQPQE